MSNASNATLLVKDSNAQYIYKPVSGERPLWDFPDGTLANRERAAYLTSELLGWNLVPRTELIEGPFGLGSVQDWVEAQVNTVDLFAHSEVPDDWINVLSGRDERGQRVVLAHSSDEKLKRVALFDAIINNADRKASHILTTEAGEHFLIDHGVTFHYEPKLRTVLWGWVDTTISDHDLDDLALLAESIDSSELAQLLDELEVSALHQRIADLIDSKKYPSPSDEWPAIPWPIF